MIYNSMCDCAGLCLCLIAGAMITYCTRTECSHYKDMEQNFIEND